MEGLGAEVSAKIRSAIKAKLIELEAYVDDELPDYIMVMVANKRTKEQMEDDLGLFLNNNTGAFTHWLHAVLEKLQKVTLGEVAKSKKEAARKKKKTAKESSSSKRPKDAKDSQKREREKKTSSSGVRREEGSSSRSRSSKKPREEGKSEPAAVPKGIPLTNKKIGTTNANVEALGKRQPKKIASPAGSSLGSGGKDGYDPLSLLKKTVAKTKDVSRPKLTAKKPASPLARKTASPSLKKTSSSSKKSVTKKSTAKKDSSRKSKSSKKSAADIFKEDGDDQVQLNLSHEDKSDPMFANLEEKAESESGGEKKKIINLKEDSEFHAGAKRDSNKQDLDFEIKKRGERERAEKAKSKKPSRSRSRSMESRRKNDEQSRSKSRESRKRRESGEGGRNRKGVRRQISRGSRSGSRERSGLASTVVKPAKHDSDDEYDPEKILKRSLASKAMIPPRPVRPTGREEQGSARAISRAVAAADRSIMTSKRRADSPPRGKRSHMESPPRGRRDRSPRGRRSESPRGRLGARSRDYDARPLAGRRNEDRGERRRDIPRLSPDDIERYKAMKEQYALKRRVDSSVEGGRRLNDGGGGKRGRREFPERRLAMDDEMEKRGRRSSLDRKLEGKREGRKEERRPMDKEDDDIRIIVRRDISPQSPPKRRREEEKRQEEVSRKQEYRRRREQERRMDEDDDELLEMRKKALESLMRRRSREDVTSGERKIIIPLDDESSSDSDSSTTSKESEVSLSDVEELKAKSRELERRVRNRQGRGREEAQPVGGRHRVQEQRREGRREEEGSDGEREPTFTVTLDGIDEKYFKKSGPLNAPLPLIRPEEEKNEEETNNGSFEKEEESDQELVLHPTEDFDEPEQEKEEAGSKKKESKDEKKAVVKEKESKEKVAIAPKAVKPVLSSSGNTTSKPVAPVTGRKRSPIRPPTESVRPPADQPKTVPAKKVAAVKPSVAAVIKPLPVFVKTVNVEQKQKSKRTPITAPEPDQEAPKAALPTFSRTISNPTFTRTISSAAPAYNTGPAALQTKSGETCKYWPRCVRGEACMFYHPPVPSSAEAILSTNANKYKWTAT